MRVERDIGKVLGELGLKKSERERLGFSDRDIELISESVGFSTGGWTNISIEGGELSRLGLEEWRRKVEVVERFLVHKKLLKKRKEPKRPKAPKRSQGEPDGDFVFMHQSMIGKFSEWIDEICLRRHGFRWTELAQIEQAIARTHAAAEGGSAEAKAECERLTKEYVEVWRERRIRIMSV
jgi:hypothetical protein